MYNVKDIKCYTFKIRELLYSLIKYFDISNNLQFVFPANREE